MPSRSSSAQSSPSSSSSRNSTEESLALRQQACSIAESCMRVINLPHSMRSILTDLTGSSHSLHALCKSVNIGELVQTMKSFSEHWAQLPHAERFFFFSILSATPDFSALGQKEDRPDPPDLGALRQALVQASANCLRGLDLATPLAFGALSLQDLLGPFHPSAFEPLVYNHDAPLPLDLDELDELDLQARRNASKKASMDPFCVLRATAALRLNQEAALLGMAFIEPLSSTNGKGWYLSRLPSAAKKNKPNTLLPAGPQPWPIQQVSAAYFYSPSLSYNWARSNAPASYGNAPRSTRISSDCAPLVLALKIAFPLSSLPKRGVWVWEREPSHELVMASPGAFLEAATMHHSAQELAEHLLATTPASSLLPWLQQVLDRRPDLMQAIVSKIAPFVPKDSAVWTPTEHPHWGLAASTKHLEGASKRTCQRLVALGETFNALGFRADGSLPNGQKVKLPDHAPTPFFTLVGADPVIAKELSPVFAHSGASFTVRNAAGASALGLLNTRLRTLSKARRLREVERFEAVLNLWVSMGADPLSIAAQPNVVDLAATHAFKELVSACVERQALVSSLTDSDLQCALELLKQHRERLTLLPGQEPVSPPSKPASRSRRI